MCVFEESKRNDRSGFRHTACELLHRCSRWRPQGCPCCWFPKAGLKLCRSMSSLRGTAAPSPQASSHFSVTPVVFHRDLGTDRCTKHLFTLWTPLCCTGPHLPERGDNTAFTTCAGATVCDQIASCDACHGGSAGRRGQQMEGPSVSPALLTL